MDILLIVACLYMAYANVKGLTEVPLAEWGTLQYVMVGLTVLLVVVGALKGWQFYKKKKAAAKAPGPEAEPETASEPAPPKAAGAAQATAEAGTVHLAAEGTLPEAPDNSGLEDWEIEAADFHYTLVEGPRDKA